MASKEEIREVLTKFQIHKDLRLTNNETIKWLLQHIEEHVPFEKPDAFIVQGEHIYGIEHFQISQYTLQRNSDLSRVAKGSQNNRDKMSVDRKFDLNPSLDNLLKSLDKNISSHATSFESYRANLTSSDEHNKKEYRLIIFIEDHTESASIVKKRGTEPINPLNLKQINDIILKHDKEIWGVIYSYGNEVSKSLTGCTIEEMKWRLQKGELLDAEDYVPFHTNRHVYVSKEDPSEDKNSITIELSSFIGRT